MMCELKLEEWGCASEIKQNQGYALWNGERGSSEFLENLREVFNFRKETEEFGRREGEILMKKGYKKGGGSL